jgi:outer membrane protein, heavy metal efflux system
MSVIPLSPWLFAILAAPATPAVPSSLETQLIPLLERARHSSPEVRLAARAVAEAEAERVGKGVIFPTNPRLAAEGRRLALAQEGTPVDPLHGLGVTLDALLEVSGAGAGRLAEADQRLALAKVELALAGARAAARAWRAWVELDVAIQQGASLDEAVQLQEQFSEAARQRQGVGAAAGPDLAAVALELATARAQREEARWTQAAAETELRASLDLAPADALPAVIRLDAPPSVNGAEALVARALERRAELAVVEGRLKVLAAAERRLELEAFPRLGVLAGYDAAPASGSYGFLGLSVELPVAQRNQGPLAVVRAQTETEGERVQALRRQIEREVVAARARYLAQLARLEVLERQAVPAAEQNRQLVEQGWRAGRFDVFRLTQASRELNRVRAERLHALRGAWAELIELERLSGGLNP